MLSSSKLMAAPLYLELAPPEEAAKQIDHLFVFRDTGVSRRRLAASRRFRQALGQLASQSLPLSGQALDAGYCDQSHMSVACRIFAGKPPGALRAQSVPRRFDLSLQDTRLKDRLRLVIDE
ncbi:AraC-like DNA-binding protein [Labrenzia sp. MBR-25]|jgi:AraC-like DNA-binding protein|nr:helix-turn-helix domain-containing protein [Roseibium aggregatum]